MSAKTTKPDRGDAAQAYYEKAPSSAVGEFAHAQAQVADLNQKGSTEAGEPFEGRPAK